MNRKQPFSKLYIIWLIGCTICYSYNTLTHSYTIWDILLFIVCPIIFQIVCAYGAHISGKKNNTVWYGIFASLVLTTPSLVLYTIQSAEIALLLPMAYTMLGLFNTKDRKIQKKDIYVVLLLTVLIKIGRWIAYVYNPKKISIIPELIMFCLSIGAMIYVFYKKERDQQIVAEMYEEAKEAINIDGLTGLLNRKGLEDHIVSCQKKASVFSVIMMDIDNFKKVNDTYGHTFGDTVLKGLAETLTSNTRCSDAVFRYGGEEFIIVCSNTNLDQAMLVAEKVRKAFRATTFMYDDKPLNFTISLGVAECTYKQYKDVKSLVDVADSNLYEAKHTGKNRVIG